MMELQATPLSKINSPSRAGDNWNEDLSGLNHDIANENIEIGNEEERKVVKFETLGHESNSIQSFSPRASFGSPNHSQSLESTVMKASHLSTVQPTTKFKSASRALVLDKSQIKKMNMT